LQNKTSQQTHCHQNDVSLLKPFEKAVIWIDNHFFFRFQHGTLISSISATIGKSLS
jgi:hypothetical protein